MAFCFRAYGQNKENPVFTSNGTQTILGIQDQRYWLADGPGRYGLGPKAEPLQVIDTARHKNPYPDSDIGLYTQGNCYEASNIDQSWAWGTWEEVGKEWIQVQCPNCLLECISKYGALVPCKCYRLIQKKIENFNPLPVVINPVVKTVYRAWFLKFENIGTFLSDNFLIDWKWTIQ